jgi:hypothetical protein
MGLNVRMPELSQDASLNRDPSEPRIKRVGIFSDDPHLVRIGTANGEISPSSPRELWLWGLQGRMQRDSGAYTEVSLPSGGPNPHIERLKTTCSLASAKRDNMQDRDEYLPGGK